MIKFLLKEITLHYNKMLRPVAVRSGHIILEVRNLMNIVRKFWDK